MDHQYYSRLLSNISLAYEVGASRIRVLRDSSASLSDQQRHELETARDNLLCETVKQGQIVSQ